MHGGKGNARTSLSTLCFGWRKTNLNSGRKDFSQQPPMPWEEGSFLLQRRRQKAGKGACMQRSMAGRQGRREVGGGKEENPRGSQPLLFLYLQNIRLPT